MSTLSPSHTTPAIRFKNLNWIAVDPLPRDQTRSQRLHEPEHRINTIDPMTGNDIENVTSHPNLHLPYPAAEGDDRGG